MDLENSFHENIAVEKNGVDVEFAPPTRKFVQECDDERTLDEEEALDPLEDPTVELSTLEKESDMPLEDLMALYGYNDPNAVVSQSSDESCDEIEGKKVSELEQLYNDSENRVRSTRYESKQQSEDEEDVDYCPEEEDKKKMIMVGQNYQAGVPEVLCKYDDALPYENEDKLVWDPSALRAKEIEDYLIKANNGAVPKGRHIRDDEQALYLLLQCGHNIEEALRRRRMNTLLPPGDAMSQWSEEECENFETGLKDFGKDFHKIQQLHVRTRSVRELVQFYYIWKKTERYDVFVLKTKAEKKKYPLHPSITDYMDRFLEEQDGTTNRDRSSSPNTNNCLLRGDSKWQKSLETHTNHDHTEPKIKVEQLSPVLKKEDEIKIEAVANKDDTNSSQ